MAAPDGPRTPLWLRSGIRRPDETQPKHAREDRPRDPVEESVRGPAGSGSGKAAEGGREPRRPRGLFVSIRATHVGPAASTCDRHVRPDTSSQQNVRACRASRYRSVG